MKNLPYYKYLSLFPNKDVKRVKCILINTAKCKLKRFVKLGKDKIDEKENSGVFYQINYKSRDQTSRKLKARFGKDV